MINILQSNLQRKRAAHDLAYAAALRANIDIIIASEPNKKLVKGNSGWVCDKNFDVAVFFCNKAIQVDMTVRKTSFVRTKLKDRTNIIACYISPNIQLMAFRSKFDEVIKECRRTTEGFVLAGDIGQDELIGPKALTDRIKEGQDRTIGNGSNMRRTVPYWWTERVAEARQAYIAARKRP